MPAFRLITLGRLRLLDASDVEQLSGRRKELALLAFIACRAPRDVSRDELAALLWGERDEERARHSLRQALLRLRQTLGPALEVGPARVAVATDSLVVDASAFESDVAAGRHRDAVDRWQGEFLEGADDIGDEAFRTWLDSKRESLRRRLEFALGSLLDSAESARSWDEAASLAEKLVELRPLDDRARLRLEAAHRNALEQRAADPAPADGGSHETQPPVETEPPALAPNRTRPRRLLWRRGTLIVSACLAIAVVTAPIWRAAHPASLAARRDRVLVAPFANETGDPALDRLSDIAADWLAQGIAKTGLVKVVRSRAAGAGAGIVVRGSFVRGETGGRDSLRFQASIADAATGEVLRSAPAVVGSASAPLVAVEALRRGTVAALAPFVDARMSGWARVASAPSSYEAYLAFGDGLDAFDRGEADRSAVDPFLRAYAFDTSFTLPLIYAAWTLSAAGKQLRADSILKLVATRHETLAPFDRALLDWLMAGHRHDRVASYEAALVVAELAPQSNFAAVELPFAALAINRPHHARRLLEHLDSLGNGNGPVRDNSGYWLAYSNALHMTGDYERQLAVARAVRRQNPAERSALSYEMRALAALGRIDELNRVLEQSIAFPADRLWGAPGLRYYIVASDELRAHGRAAAADSVLATAIRVYSGAPDDVRAIPKQRFEMARALYRLGRLDEAKGTFAEIVSTDALTPLVDYGIEARAHLGFIAARTGDVATARATDRWLRDLSGPYLLGQNTELRAALHALLDEPDEAVRLLHQSMAEGRFFDIGKHTSFEYQRLRGFASFEAWLAPKG